MSVPRTVSARTTRRMLESAILIGIAMVLSEFAKFSSTWLFGGSVTLGSIVPLVLISWRWGTRQGLFSAFVFSLLQMFVGFKNVTYGQTVFQMVLIALLDYVVAFTVVGLAAVFRKAAKNQLVALGGGILLVSALRFLCHFVSGWMIWDALWPNDKGLSGAAYSLIYNGGYMLPETLVALVIALLLFVPLRRYWLGEDLTEARAG
ncbi:MAG: energy-coupled thiamine transporter ThiT [Clostridiales bacterium]|nr:energy-coupled thiamine transporter ThiT [Clostridiales bacterium]